jgi:hypothetical protein
MKISQLFKRHPTPAALHESTYMKNTRNPSRFERDLVVAACHIPIP